MDQLATHGIAKTPQMVGLTDEQIAELGHKDESDKYYPSGGSQFVKDDIGYRTGHAPQPPMQEVLRKTIAEAKAAIHKVRLRSTFGLRPYVAATSLSIHLPSLSSRT